VSSSPEGNERKQDKRKIMQEISQHADYDPLQTTISFWLAAQL